MPKQPLLFLSAGEDSGDLHASNLMAELKDLSPGIGFVGLGKSRMLAQGLEPVEDIGSGAVMWHHAFGKVPRMIRLFRRSKETFRSRKPDAVVLVDYVGFNLYLARSATRMGIPVVYYISPQVWAHSAYRVSKFKKWVDRMVVIYPFEVDFYESRGMDVRYVGHPLFDELAKRPVDESRAAEFRGRFAGPLVAVAPGSRRHEISANLPIAVEACKIIKESIPEAGFAVSCINPEARAVIGEMLNSVGFSTELYEGDLAELASAATVCISKSGTASTQIAATGTPLVVFYRISAPAYFMSRPLMNVPYITMANLLAGEEVVPEKLMWKADPEWVARMALQWLKDPDARQAASERIRNAVAAIAAPGASRRAAEEILRFLNGS